MCHYWICSIATRFQVIDWKIRLNITLLYGHWTFFSLSFSWATQQYFFCDLIAELGWITRWCRTTRLASLSGWPSGRLSSCWARRPPRTCTGTCAWSSSPANEKFGFMTNSTYLSVYQPFYRLHASIYWWINQYQQNYLGSWQLADVWFEYD